MELCSLLFQYNDPALEKATSLKQSKEFKLLQDAEHTGLFSDVCKMLPESQEGLSPGGRRNSKALLQSFQGSNKATDFTQSYLAKQTQCFRVGIWKTSKLATPRGCVSGGVGGGKIM